MKFVALVSLTAAVQRLDNHPGATRIMSLQVKNAAHSEAGCEDQDWYSTDTAGDGCSWYYDNQDSCGDYDDWDFWADYWCCACGGGW